MNVASLPPKTEAVRRKLIFQSAYDTLIDAGDEAHIASVARQILRENPRLDRVPPFGPLCTKGLADAPSLLIEDHSGIQLAHERGADRNLSYRAVFLGGEGDLLAVYGDRDERFEAYCRNVLCLGAVTVLAPPVADAKQTLAKACLEDEALLETATDIARNAGTLNVIPYMVTGGVWRLAQEISARAGAPVHVAGPGPTLARAVNDKLWFAHCAALLLGRDAVPHNRTVYGMAALVGHLRRFIQDHHVVGLKLPQSAASLGNMVLEGSDLTQQPATAIATHLSNAMDERGWDKPFPLQLTAWEGPLLGSPSAQLWIPQPNEGPPLVEAIFDQVTSGSIARFVGGVPSTLSDQLRQKLAREAACLGSLFQRLGYFGRCSFDAVVVGEAEADAEIHWVECNGRWGGMSLPMTLANRLTGDWRSGGFLVFSHHDPQIAELGLNGVLARCNDILFRAGGRSGIVLLSPGRIVNGGIDMLAIATDQDGARELTESAISRITD